jgi:hypothetical protein
MTIYRGVGGGWVITVMIHNFSAWVAALVTVFTACTQTVVRARANGQWYGIEELGRSISLIEILANTTYPSHSVSIGQNIREPVIALASYNSSIICVSLPFSTRLMPSLFLKNANIT